MNTQSSSKRLRGPRTLVLKIKEKNIKEKGG